MRKPYNIIIKAKLFLDPDDKKGDPDQFVQDTAIFFSEELSGWELLEVEVYDISTDQDAKNAEDRKVNSISSFKILKEKDKNKANKS